MLHPPPVAPTQSASQPGEPTRRSPSAQAPAALLELRLLGGFELRVRDGAPIALPTRKCEALLALLAMRPGELVSREKLCGLLWPKFRDVQARQSLRQSLHYIRKSLPASALPPMRGEPRMLALDATHVHVDVASIEQLVADGSRAALYAATRLYRGNLLEGIAIDEHPFELWMTLERERLRELMVSGLVRLIDLQTSAEELSEATQSCLRLLQLEPLHEVTHRSLMRLHLRQGRRASAFQVYQNLAQLLRAELGAQPDAVTRELYAQMQQPLEPERPLEPAQKPERSVTNSHAQTLERPVADLHASTVGRRSELSTLHSALAQSWAEGAEVHLLVGEAGIGKTHLTERLAEHAGQRGARVLRGRCFESEQVFPLALWSNLLGSAWRREGSQLLDDLRALPAELRAELVALLPELDAPSHADMQPDALRTCRAVLRALRALLAPAPLLLVLEDLHWADEMSLRLLCYLARHQARSPGCFMLGSLREEELTPNSFLHTALAELDREHLLRRLHMAPLSRADSLELAQQTARAVRIGVLEEPVLEQFWSLSEGNPLVIMESARSLALAAGEDGPRPRRVPVEAAPGMKLPERVRALIRSRVRRVSPAARELLAFAAVAGRELGVDVLVGAGLAGPQLTAALEELIERQLMCGRDDRIDFTHDRIRETLYSELAPARRRLLHAAVAAALEQRYEGRLEPVLGHIGYHHSNAGNAEQAVHFLLRFAENARRGPGAAEALSALERAAADSTRLPCPQRERMAIEIVLHQASCLASLGRFNDLIARLDGQRARLEALQDSALAGSFHFWWGFACTLLAERREGEHHARTALGHATRAGDARTTNYAHTLLAYICAVSGRCAEGLQHGQAAVSGLAQTTRDYDALTLAWLMVALNQLWQGDWPKAHAAAQRAEAIALAAESQRARALSATSLAYAYAYTQQWALAMEAVGRGLEASTEPFTLAHALWISGFVQAGGGEPAKAIGELQLVIEQLEAHGMRAQSAHSRVSLAAAYLRVGEAPRALEIVVDALQISRVANDRPGIGASLRVQGEAALAMQDWASARTSLDEAMQVFRSFGARIEIANTWVVLAKLALATDDAASARAYLEQARWMYLECGAERAAAHLAVAYDAPTDALMTANS